IFSFCHLTLKNFTFVANQFFMGFIIKVLVTGLAAWVAAYILPGVHLENDAKTIIVVALVLALLNAIVKPILVILTIPVTIVTLGLFLLVINALMVVWTSKLVNGFKVDGWLTALLFSLIVSVVSSILHSIAKDRRRD
ncbi:MAG TPA: phage holin family protein, partial [Flavisolibacter sp.]|nr:phage holin family protein [Flavisolibacter sp.]